MTNYDVVVVGSGPAGASCARELSSTGIQTLLIEKAKDFRANNFSTAGAPYSLQEDFGLPDDVVAKVWSRLQLFTSSSHCSWESNEPEGIVMDFAKLRAFLASQATALWMDTLYKSHEVQGDQIAIKVRKQGQEQTLWTQVLVDATGSERNVLNKQFDKRKALEATGTEVLIKVPEAAYAEWGDAVSIFIGEKWMPHGYAWIFPMAPNELKVGIGRYFIQKLGRDRPFRHHLDHLLKTIGEHEVLEKHGKTLVYCSGRHDPHYSGNVIAVGDAVSTLNPLAGEGIRHGMMSGQLAAEAIAAHLNGHKSAFRSYQRKLGKYCGLRWQLSERVMHALYWRKDEAQLERVLQTFKAFKPRALFRLLFNYNLKEMAKFFWYYLTKSGNF